MDQCMGMFQRGGGYMDQCRYDRRGGGYMDQCRYVWRGGGYMEQCRYARRVEGRWTRHGVITCEM